MFKRGKFIDSFFRWIAEGGLGCNESRNNERTGCRMKAAASFSDWIILELISEGCCVVLFNDKLAIQITIFVLEFSQELISSPDIPITPSWVLNL